MEQHPLDDEDIAIVVTLTHGPTLTQSVGISRAAADDGIFVKDHVMRATEQALDDMLARLENVGG
jgi:hypothetical protein